jgi:hypothetical protein
MGYDLTRYLDDATTNGIQASDFKAKYKDYHMIVYAVSQLAEEQAKLKNGSEKLDIPELTDMQLKFLDYMDITDSTEDDVVNINTACTILGIRKSELVIWIKTNKLFARCYEILKEAEAEQAESVLWSSATSQHNKDSISRMFALKARKPEYRENAPAPGDTVVNVRISVDGQVFDSTAGFKVAGNDIDADA